LKLLENSPELMHQHLSKKLASLPQDQLLALNESLVLLVQCFDLNDESASPLITIDDFQQSAEEESEANS